MNKLKNNKKLFLVLGILGLVLITTGITYAFFRYTKEGSTENSIKSGSITFIYTEESNGISIEDALPTSDIDGKAQKKYFDFKIRSNTTMAEIPYSITVRKKDNSTLLEDAIKLYLTEVKGENEEELVLEKYSNLADASWIEDYNDKVLYEETVPVSGIEYVKNYRLRMWVDREVNLADKENEEYKYNNKIFSLTVNVYTSQGRSLTQDNLTTKDDTRIKMVTLNDKYLLEESDETGVDLEVSVPNDVESGYFTVTENNMLANSTVTEIGNNLSVSSYIKRLSASSEFNLNGGITYYKLRTISADKEKTQEYILKVNKKKSKDNNLASLGVEGYSFQEEFDKDRLEYHLSLEDSSINILGNKSSDVAQIEGIGEKNLNWGENTFNVKVTSESGESKIYKIIVNNVRPTAPTITGGTGTTTVTTDQTISISSAGTAISGVKNYEYYKTTSTIAPSDSTTATGTTSNTLKVSDVGTTYIYYRTVSKSGNKSVWSSKQVIIIRKLTLGEQILEDNTVFSTSPTLTTSSNNTTNRDGLYSKAVTGGFSNGTNGTTYYFRGNVTNNYVSFAGKTWRIIRINEDGTIRLILNDTIDTGTYFNASAHDNYSSMYYSNSNAKTVVNNWYTTNIANKGYSSKVATGNYFCEAAVVGYSDLTANKVTLTLYSNYTPTFKCTEDKNRKKYINASVGLINYDEVVFAGGYNDKDNKKYYLYKSEYNWWTMSPAGYVGAYGKVWRITNTGALSGNNANYKMYIRPVINLISTVTATKNSSGYYVVQ